MYKELEKSQLIDKTILSIGEKLTSKDNYKCVEKNELAEILDYAIENGTYFDVLSGYHSLLD